jgi:hypothetical protein
MEKSQGGQAVTPVSIPPDPYQRALKELRLASEELREAKDRIKRLEREIEVLRFYGNKGCTAVADKILARNAKI